MTSHLYYNLSIYYLQFTQRSGINIQLTDAKVILRLNRSRGKCAGVCRVCGMSANCSARGQKQMKEYHGMHGAIAVRNTGHKRLIRFPTRRLPRFPIAWNPREPPARHYLVDSL